VFSMYLILSDMKFTRKQKYAFVNEHNFKMMIYNVWKTFFLDLELSSNQESNGLGTCIGLPKFI
jgi:hypothetical protein